MSIRKEKSTLKIMRISFDLAKAVFQIYDVNVQEKPIYRRLQEPRFSSVNIKNKFRPSSASANCWT